MTDSQASNGKYLTVKTGTQSLDSAPSSEEKPVCTMFLIDTKRFRSSA
ncbi:MAG TPA: hypothetical protein P5028_03450 [Candidatus Marinimicrobia bacterium]|nr:hypothetical protein [Candidatus Neomarinimicrobiota bacterium]